MYWVSGLLAGCPKKVSPHLSEETGMKLLTSLTAAGSNRDKGILFPAIGALLLLRGSFSVLTEVKQSKPSSAVKSPCSDAAVGTWARMVPGLLRCRVA